MFLAWVGRNRTEFELVYVDSFGKTWNGQSHVDALKTSDTSRVTMESHLKKTQQQFQRDAESSKRFLAHRARVRAFIKRRQAKEQIRVFKRLQKELDVQEETAECWRVVSAQLGTEGAVYESDVPPEPKHRLDFIEGKRHLYEHCHPR